MYTFYSFIINIKQRNIDRMEFMVICYFHYNNSISLEELLVGGQIKCNLAAIEIVLPVS